MVTRLLAGQHVVVTGGNRGIGWATVQTLAANGASLTVTSRSSDDGLGERLGSLAEQHAVSLAHEHLDIGEPDSVKQLIATLRRADLPITGLVNNAGVTLNALFQMTSTSQLRDVFDINFFGLVGVMQGCARLMARNKVGSIVNILFDRGGGRQSGAIHLWCV